MLRSINEIIGYTFFAKEDDVGKCKDLLFDDQLWTVRHMVADTGGWLVGKKSQLGDINLFSGYQ